MANYCKYCGKKLEGAPCDCPEAVAEAEKKAREMVQKAMRQAGMDTAAARAQADAAAEPQVNAEVSGAQVNAQAAPKSDAGAQPQQAPYQQYQSQQYQNQQQYQPQQDQRYQQTGALQHPSAPQVPLTQSHLFLQMKTLLIGMFRQPAATFQKALAEQNKAPQYLIGAIWALYTLILFTVSLHDEFGDMTTITVAFIYVIGVAVLRTVWAAGAFALSGRYNRQIRIDDALGLFCLPLIYDAAVTLIADICFQMGLYEAAGAVLLFGLFVQLVAHFLSVWTLVKGNMEAAFRISVILLLAVSAVGVIVAGDVVLNIVRVIANEFQYWAY